MVSAVLIVIALLVLALTTSLGTATGSSTPVVARIVSVAVPALLVAVALLSLKVEVCVVALADGRALQVRYGFGLVKQTFRAPTIVSVNARTYSMMQMGGWGYRGSLRLLKYAAVVTRGGEALELQLVKGRRFVVSVDQPERFVEALATS